MADQVAKQVAPNIVTALMHNNKWYTTYYGVWLPAIVTIPHDAPIYVIDFLQKLFRGFEAVYSYSETTISFYLVDGSKKQEFAQRYYSLAEIAFDREEIDALVKSGVDFISTYYAPLVKYGDF